MYLVAPLESSQAHSRDDALQFVRAFQAIKASSAAEAVELAAKAQTGDYVVLEADVLTVAMKVVGE